VPPKALAHINWPKGVLTTSNFRGLRRQRFSPLSSGTHLSYLYHHCSVDSFLLLAFTQETDIPCANCLQTATPLLCRSLR
jgi:hypothetical protein